MKEKRRLRHGDLIAVGETYLLFSKPPSRRRRATPSPDGAQTFTLRDLRAARTNQSLESRVPARQTRLMHSSEGDVVPARDTARCPSCSSASST